MLSLICALMNAKFSTNWDGTDHYSTFSWIRRHSARRNWLFLSLWFKNMHPLTWRRVVDREREPNLSLSGSVCATVDIIGAGVGVEDAEVEVLLCMCGSDAIVSSVCTTVHYRVSINQPLLKMVNQRRPLLNSLYYLCLTWQFRWLKSCSSTYYSLSCEHGLNK